MTSRAALPMPDDVEADIARALYLRDLEPEQRYFWALEAAFVFDRRGSVNDATEADLEEIDGRWRDLNREGVRALIHATPGTTRQVLAAVAQFPAEDRDWAYAHERARLTYPGQQLKKEGAFTAELLGERYTEDVGWLAELGKWTGHGATVRRAWQRWSRSGPQLARLSVEREPELIRLLLQEPNSVSRRLMYAERLCEHPSGQSYGEYLQLVTSGSHWRAKVLLENDVGVLGPMAGCWIDPQWRDGFIVGARCVDEQLPCLLAHPGSFTLADLWLETGGAAPRLTVELPLLEQLRLEVRGAMSDAALRDLREWLVEVVDCSRLQRVTLDAGRRRHRHRLLAALEPLAGRVQLVDAFEGGGDEEHDD
jgi:hypothetical protein